MRRTLLTLLAPFALAAPALAQSPLCEGIPAPSPLVGERPQASLCDYFSGAKAVLVVNTASMCGFTPQFKSLETAYQEFSGQGLQILGFPSDDFGGQEHASASKTAEVCYRNYGVTFPMFSQIDVKGPNAHPLFQRAGDTTESPPRWNFHKYLITPGGTQAFDSRTTPTSDALRAAIEAALAQDERF